MTTERIITEANQHLATGIEKVEGLSKYSTSIIFYCKDGYSVHFSDPGFGLVSLETADSLDNEDDIYTDCKWCKFELAKQETKGDGWHTAVENWFFYKFETDKGYDTLRFHGGDGDGYYADEVEIVVKTPREREAEKLGYYLRTDGLFEKSSANCFKVIDFKNSKAYLRTISYVEDDKQLQEAKKRLEEVAADFEILKKIKD